MADLKLTTWEILRNRFPANEYVLIEEVSDASGFSRSRSLDYMLINLWESRGLAVTGIEQKSNRGDWLKEIKNPAKQEKHFKHCDYFYLITDREGVAKLDEIPLNWGWYHINEKRILKTMKSAPKLTSEPIGRSLLCAMLRRAASKENYVHQDSIKSQVEVRAQAIKEGNDYALQQKAKGYEDLKKTVEDFEVSSGIKIRDYWQGGDKIGKAVKQILTSGVDGYKRDLTRLKNTAQSVYESLEKIIGEL